MDMTAIITLAGGTLLALVQALGFFILKSGRDERVRVEAKVDRIDTELSNYRETIAQRYMPREEIAQHIDQRLRAIEQLLQRIEERMQRLEGR